MIQLEGSGERRGNLYIKEKKGGKSSALDGVVVGMLKHGSGNIKKK